MWLDQVSHPGPLALESDALPTLLHGAAVVIGVLRGWAADEGSLNDFFLLQNRGISLL